MKKFLAILIITLTFQAPSLADDIRDFKIEGMTIGDSALDYFSEDQIKNNKRNYYNNEEFFPSELAYLPSFKIYDAIQITYKNEDKQYKLHEVVGFIDFPKNIKDCNNKMKEIIKNVSELFSDTKKEKYKRKHDGDPSGKSIITKTTFILDSGTIDISCNDWSKQIGYLDTLRVSIKTREFNTWLINKAYNQTNERFIYIPSAINQASKTRG
jgi:hypothetical protein|tara:strand:+ start:152 stop:787 length:636 start_codon:yes stop_codon:yes gene_type:complete